MSHKSPADGLKKFLRDQHTQEHLQANIVRVHNISREITFKTRGGGLVANAKVDAGIDLSELVIGNACIIERYGSGSTYYCVSIVPSDNSPHCHHHTYKDELGLSKYVSTPWMAVAGSTTYTVEHALGNLPSLIQCWFHSGTGITDIDNECMTGIDSSTSWQSPVPILGDSVSGYVGYYAYNITRNSLTFVTRANVGHNQVGGLAAAGFYKFYLWG